MTTSPRRKAQNPSGVPPATQLLRDDHKRVRGLFSQLDALSERAPERVGPVSSELFMELEIHSAAERDLFYPALLDAVAQDAEARTELDQAEAAHDFIDGAVRELRNLAVDAEGWWDRLFELHDAFEAHFAQEERVLLSAAEKWIGEAKLEELSLGLIDFRERELLRPEYALARPEVVQNPSGGEQRRKIGD